MNNIKIESVTNDEATSSIPYKSKQVTKSLSLWFELKVFFFFFQGTDNIVYANSTCGSALRVWQISACRMYVITLPV
jgi:hypothetical protein